MPPNALHSFRHSRDERRSRSGGGRDHANEGEREGAASNAARRSGQQPLTTGTVTIENLNLRRTPNGAVLGQLARDAQVDVLSIEGSWFKVLHQGEVAYVYGKHVVLRALPVGDDNDGPGAGPGGGSAPKPEQPKRRGFFARLFGRRDDDHEDEQDREVEQEERGNAKAWNKELKGLLSRKELDTKSIQRARLLIEQLPEEQQGDACEALQACVPYANQRDNESTQKGKKIGDVMCNLTSLAMALQMIGVPNPHPEMQYEDALEKIRRERGLPARTTDGGWGGVAKALGVHWRYLAAPHCGAQSQDFWMNKVRNALRSGKGVMMSIEGHIMRVQGVTSKGLVVDDPFGKSQLYGDSYAFTEANATDHNNHVGDNHVWPWKMVLGHDHHWVAEFSR